MPQQLFPDDVIEQDFGPDEDASDDEYEFDDEYDDTEEPEDEVPVGVSPDDPIRDRKIEVITIEELEAVDDTAEEPFFVKEWGKHVILKGISMEELRLIRRKSSTKQARLSGSRRDIMEKELIIAGLVQPEGNERTYQILVQKSAGAVADIANRILDKSGMGNKAETAREQRFPGKR